MKFFSIVLISLLSLQACKNQKSFSDITIGNTDDFSNKNPNTEQSMVLRELENSKEKSRTKVHYKDSVYSYVDFVKNIGWSDVTPVRIIRDSIEIKSYHIKNCKTLIVVE